MTSLQLYQQPTVLAEIPNRDHEIAHALTSRLFSSIEDVEAYQIMKNCIVKAYIVSRYESPVGDELKVLVDETMKVFKSKIGSIRENEIQICFTRGIIGEYGDFKGLSLPTFMKFGNGYLRELSRIKLTTEAKEDKTPSKLDRFKTAFHLALNTLNDYEQGKSIELQGATVYRFLMGIGIIQYTEQEQCDFIEGATNEVIAKRQREKITSLDKHIRNQIEKELENPFLLKEKIIRQAQHNGLVAYFQEIILNEETPEDYLEQKIKQYGQKFL